MPAELLETAARIFRAEAADGYRDRVVIGGLSGFAARLQDVAQGDQVADLLGDYGALPPEERAARLDAAQSLLTSPLPLGEVARSAGEGYARADTLPSPSPSPTGRGSAAPHGVTLATRIDTLRGVGPVRARLYTRLGIHVVGDLLFHFPVRHQAFPPVSTIGDLFFKPEGSVEGTLERLEVESLPRGLKRLRATVRDATGSVHAVWLRHGVARIGINTGERIALSGRLILQGRQLVFENPDYERADGPPIHTRRLVPIHPLTAGLSDKELRGRIFWALTHFAASVVDPLPESVRARHALIGIDRALWQMHFPDSADEYADARRRFAFEELLTIQLMVLRRRITWRQDPSPSLPRQQRALDALEGGLPFELTRAQRRVADEILGDMALSKPMTRLLQGEVGSGKTAVAALALMNAVAGGYQGVLMAPTEILAEQHFATVAGLFEAAGPGLEAVLGRRPAVTLLTGSVKGKARTRAYEAVATGEADLVVGTQALIQERLEFARLGLVIVDEQHRFGVRQRVSLRRRAGSDGEGVPHLLVMTATPIPRTLALSLYGDLDLSAIDEMPPGRQFPRTRLLGSDERDLAYERVRRAAERGEQSFVICPLVEESEALQAKSATEEYERLRAGELANLRLALLHGRMRAADKDAIMRAFRDHEYDVLVSTAVVEVGVDVPNATVMLIEGAERFGLAQLHQFRGRVGRGGQPSVCILLTEPPDPDANERLAAVVETTNGLELAERDLRLRGPGDYFGVRQSGMPELKVARLDDAPLVESARASAAQILAADPELARDEHRALATHLAEFVAGAGDPS
ncbi:MAG: ATP-dependent DNA helicase RecG [Chloroflexi bacterium]|nr:ATP-dependent DNA helicase RecG [Chloroflexota bacterium]